MMFTCPQASVRTVSLVAAASGYRDRGGQIRGGCGAALGLQEDGLRGRGVQGHHAPGRGGAAGSPIQGRLLWHGLAV